MLFSAHPNIHYRTKIRLFGAGVSEMWDSHFYAIRK